MRLLIEEAVRHIPGEPDANGRPTAVMVCGFTLDANPVHHVFRRVGSQCLCGERWWYEFLNSPELAEWQAQNEA